MVVCAGNNPDPARVLIDGAVLMVRDKRIPSRVTKRVNDLYIVRTHKDSTAVGLSRFPASHTLSIVLLARFCRPVGKPLFKNCSQSDWPFRQLVWSILLGGVLDAWLEQNSLIRLVRHSAGEASPGFNLSGARMHSGIEDVVLVGGHT
jgi:hypothetical protein